MISWDRAGKVVRMSLKGEPCVAAGLVLPGMCAVLSRYGLGRRVELGQEGWLCY